MSLRRQWHAEYHCSARITSWLVADVACRAKMALPANTPARSMPALVRQLLIGELLVTMNNCQLASVTSLDVRIRSAHEQQVVRICPVYFLA